MGRAAELFADLLDATPAEVEARLAQEAPEVANQVRALLAHDRQAAGFLEPVWTPGPHRLGRFELREILGEGGMGVVYSAYDPHLDREVALKVVGGLAAGAHHALLTEAKAHARVSHPHVVPLYEAGEHNGQVFMVMEKVLGPSLRAVAKQKKWTDTLTLLLQAGEGLAAVHRANLVHRDIKPENILVDTHGRARLTDFGLAQLESKAAGTPLYMAPEQWTGGWAGPASDQFSYAVMALELLAGKHPFEPDSGENMAQRLFRPPRYPRPDPIPPELWALLERAIQPRVEARWPNLEALLAQLRYVAGPGFQRDLGVGARVRGLLAGILCVLPAVGYTVMRVRFGDTPPQARQLFLMSFGMAAPVLGALAFAWRSLKRTQINRASFLVISLGALALVGSRGISTLANMAAPTVFSHDLWTLSFVLAMAAYTIHRAFYFSALVLMVAALLVAVFPAFYIEFFAAAMFVSAVTTAAIWTGVIPAKRN